MISEEESILELKKEIEILKLEKEELNRFFSLNVDLLCIADQHGNFLKLNKSWESVLGYSLEELQNQKFVNFIHPDDIPITNEALAKLNNEPIFNFINRYRSKNGTYKYLEWSGKQFDGHIYCTARDITQQFEFQRIIQKKEESLRKAQSLSKIGSWEFDLISFELNWSEEHYKIFELEEQPSHTLYTAYRKKIHPDDIPTLDKFVNNAIEKGENFTYEHRVVCNNGRIKNVVGIGEVIKDNNNKPIKIHGTVQDITEHKANEEALFKKEQQLRLALNGGELGMWDWNFTTGNLEVNTRWLTMLGLHPDLKPTIETWSLRVHPDDIAKLDFLVKAVILNPSGTNFETEIRALHENGNYIWILDKGAVVERDNNGNPTRIVGTHLDITNQILSNQEIQEMEKRFRDLVNSTQGIVWEASADTFQFSYVSKNAERILGYPLNQWYEPNFWQEHIYSDDRLNAIDYCTAQTSQCMDHDFEYRFLAANGNVIWLRDIVNIVLENGKPKYLRGLMIDITKAKEIESDLIRARGEAEAANRSKSEFLANMSHELRTPLNSVITLTDLLIKSNLSELQNNYLKIVLHSANALLDLLNNILDYAKLESGKIELKTEKVEFAKLIEQAVNIVKINAQEKKLSVHIEIPENFPKYIFIDCVRLRQILFNLIINAIKFTEKGNIKIQVSILHFNQLLKRIHFSVSVKDTGIGISSDNQEKILDAFTQVDTSTNRKYKGIGLGLSISNALLKLMNSKLQLESQIEKGSNFHFTLETLFEEEQISTLEKNNKEESVLNNPIESLNNNFKILVVDDDEINIFLVKTILKEILPNAFLFEAINGKEALDVYFKEEPDLIFLDIQMPEMNGLEVTKAIRSSEQNKKTIIVALTAGTMKGDKEKCLEIGMDDYASKPFVKDTIANLINKWLLNKI